MIMCPIHRGGRVHGCKICAQSISTIKYLNTEQAVEVVRVYREEDFTPFIEHKPPKAITPAPPKPVEDPMIVLADLADVIDEKQRRFRVAVVRYIVGLMVFMTGVALLVLGLFLIDTLLLVGGPVLLGGLVYLLNQGPPSTKYLAIHEARAEFARAQRRVGQ